jgi:hypothetical protein
MGMVPILDIENKHYDIIFLEKRLCELVKRENYENAVRVKRWITELALLHHGIEENELDKLLKFD